MRRAILLVLVVAVAALFGTMPSVANERATPVDTPNGDRYYIYAHGGEFPTGHAIEIWQETNGLTACGVPEGVPIGHGTQPGTTSSGLQVKTVTCNGTSYPPDTKIA